MTRTVIGVIASILFLLLAFVAWLVYGKSWFALFVLLIPSYLCSHYLSNKIFSIVRADRIYDKDFSVIRIVYALLLGGLLVGAIYVVGWASYRWLF